MKTKMERVPDVASTYRGRVLVGLKEDLNPIDRLPRHDEVAHKERCAKPARENMPRLQHYVLRALIVSGSEIPTFETKNPIKTKPPKMFVKVSVGLLELCSDRVENDEGCCNWYQVRQLVIFECLS